MTNKNIILLFLAKPLDKHDITPVHITYSPLLTLTISETSFEVNSSIGYGNAIQRNTFTAIL